MAMRETFFFTDAHHIDNLPVLKSPGWQFQFSILRGTNHKPMMRRMLTPNARKLIQNPDAEHFPIAPDIKGGTF